MSKDGFLPSTTNTEYGSNSNEVGVKSVDVNQLNSSYAGARTDTLQQSKGGVTAVQMHQPGTDMVVVQGGATTKRDVAVKAGLPYQELVPYAETTSGEVAEQTQAPQGGDLVAQGNAEYDNVLGSLSVEDINMVANGIVDMRDEAIEFANKHMPNYVQGKLSEIYGWMSENGLPDQDCMTRLLPYEAQREARAAALRGDRMTFSRYCQQTLSIANELANDPDIIAQIREEGGDVINGHLYLDGHNQGPVAECFMTGVLWIDEGAE